jgi:hypothetical protein
MSRLPVTAIALLLAAGPALGQGSASAEGIAGARGLRVDGLSDRPPPRILVFIVRGPEIQVPLAAMQTTARSAIDTHVFARALSMEEAFVRGGDALEEKLRACKGEDACYTQFASAIDAQYLAVVGARAIGGETLVSARLIEVASGRAIGSAIDAVPSGRSIVDVIPERMEAAFPRELWDPFGELGIDVRPAGAELAINGRIVGIAPLPTLGYLMPGSYRVKADKAEHEPREITVEVTRRARADVQLELTPISSGIPWWVWVVGGAAVAGGVGVGVWAATSGSGPLQICSAPGNGCAN